MASPAGTKHSPASLLVAVTAGVYGVGLACWLLGTSGVVPHYARGPLVWAMTLVLFGGPILLAWLSLWCAVAMFRNPAQRSLGGAAALLIGIAGIVGLAALSYLAFAGAAASLL